MKCNPYLEFLGINKGAIGGIQADFAENNICGLVQQPANSLSSLAYILAGIMIYKKFASAPFLALFAGLGLGSIMLHATTSAVGQIVDFGSIFLFIIYLLYLTLTKNNYLPKSKAVILTSFIFTIELLILLFAIQYRILLLIFILILLLTLENKAIKLQQLNSKTWSKAWLIFMASFGIWLLDEYRIWDLDLIEHVINAHAIWHIGTAISLYLVSEYYLQKDIICQKKF